MTANNRLFHVYQDGNFYELRQGDPNATNILTLHVNDSLVGDISFNEIRKFIEFKIRSEKNDNGKG